jgi:hypothetical protein
MGVVRMWRDAIQQAKIIPSVGCVQPKHARLVGMPSILEVPF